MTYTDGSTFEGQFIDGKPNGKGKKTMPNGNIIEGSFKDGIKHGEQRLYSAKDNTWSTEEYRSGKKWGWNKAKNVQHVSPFMNINKFKERETGWAR